MSAHVDVLAVLRRMAGMALAMRECTRVDDARRAVAVTEDDEAIAAVAELIDAVNAAAFNATPLRLNDHQTCIRVKPDYWDSILCALARVKGGAA